MNRACRSFIFLFFLVVPLVSASGGVNGSAVFVDDDRGLVSLTPHTLAGSGYVYLSLTSKQYSGDVNIVFGFNKSYVVPTSFEYYSGGSWLSVPGGYGVRSFSYDGKDTWRYVSGVPVVANHTYLARIWLEVPEVPFGGSSSELFPGYDSKYGVAFYPSAYGGDVGAALGAGHLVYLDPWVLLLTYYHLGNVSDNFNDASINTSIWKVISGGPVEGSGYIELNDNEKVVLNHASAHFPVGHNFINWTFKLVGANTGVGYNQNMWSVLNNSDQNSTSDNNIFRLYGPQSALPTTANMYIENVERVTSLAAGSVYSIVHDGRNVSNMRWLFYKDGVLQHNYPSNRSVDDILYVSFGKSSGMSGSKYVRIDDFSASLQGINYTNYTFYDHINVSFVVNDTVNGGLISGLCTDVYNATWSLTRCNSSGTQVHYVGLLLANKTYTVNATSLGVGDGSSFLYPSVSTTYASYFGGSLLLNATPFVLSLGFYDSETRVLINYSWVEFEVINDYYGANYSTANGYLTVSDALLVDNTYFRYETSGYVQNFQIFNPLEDVSSYAYNLSLLNDTSGSAVTITVYDTLGNALEGAIIYVQRYDPSTNSFSVVSTGITNFQGQTKVSLTLNDEYYKFLIEYDDELRLTTQPTYVYGTTLSFYIDISEPVLEDYLTSGSISGRVSVNSVKSLATFLWSDGDATATQGCLYGYKPVAGNLVLINTSCASTYSGTVYMMLNNVSSTTWFLSGKVLKDGTWYEIDTERVDYDVVLPDTNGYGLFLMFVILCVLTFIGFWNLEVAVMLGSMTPLLFTIIGLANIGYAISIPVLIAGIIITIILAVRK